MLKNGMVVFLFFLSIKVSAFQVEVVKDKFQINEPTAPGIIEWDHATVAMNQSGDFIVTWDVKWDPAVNEGWMEVFARAFDNQGNPKGSEFQLNETTVGFQRIPDVATNGLDRFVVVWSSGKRSTGYDVYAKMLDSSGTSISSEFKVNTSSSASRTWPDVAMYNNEDFIVIWDEMGNIGTGPGQELNYYIQHFDKNGTPQLSVPQKVNQTSSEPPEEGELRGLPDIAVQGTTGSAVAVWERIENNTSILAGRRFDPYEMVISKEIDIDPPTESVDQRRPLIDANNQGQILITWTEQSQQESDVYVKKFDGRWSAKSSPHITQDNISQHRSVGKLIESGGLVLAWTQNRLGKEGVYMRFFSANGNPIGEEIIVDETDDNTQALTSLSVVNGTEDNPLILCSVVNGTEDVNPLFLLADNTLENYSQRRPAIGLKEDGNSILMIVTWETVVFENHRPRGLGIYGKLYQITR